ncbi:hypothetical protein ITJ66_16425 [Plantibacter sp. VKM Ac-2885]|jgi:hypothetical protein|uniref:hypothetical protein n=1 Tax=Plantibacter sp. VKM Ac-2885 TaxID=2783828 RepID=UPI00188B8E9C|nr:hypothetical protein [Plantibacter sp. VKM Ac-2885]MBF4514072.1 hypothetical protein [Plantibacter sp. VKM Ac-2885]
MKNTLVVVALTSMFVSLVLRLVWPQVEFLAGLSLALQIGGIILLVIYIAGYARGRARSRA